MNLREELLALATQTKPAMQPLKFMGRDLFVKEMNAAERDAYEATQVEASKDGRALENFRVRLLVRVLADAEGNRVFVDADADILGRIPAREISAAFDVASELNALRREDEADLEKK